MIVQFHLPGSVEMIQVYKQANQNSRNKQITPHFDSTKLGGNYTWCWQEWGCSNQPQETNFGEFRQSLREITMATEHEAVFRRLLYKSSKWENSLHEERAICKGSQLGQINTNFHCSTQKSFSMRAISMTIFSFLLPAVPTLKKSKSCRQVKHPVYLPPNTVPLGELLQLSHLWERNKPGKKKPAQKVNINRKLLMRVWKETHT